MSTNVNNNSDESDSDESQTDSAVGIELTYNKHLITLRRSKVLELWSKGWSQERIASELGVSQPLVSLDIQFIQCKGREEMESFITELLPNSIKKALTSLNLITLEAWDTVERAKQNHDERTKLQALSLIQSVEADKIEIASNVDIVNKVITQQTEQRRQQQQPVLVRSQTSIEEPVYVSNDTSIEEPIGEGEENG